MLSAWLMSTACTVLYPRSIKILIPNIIDKLEKFMNEIRVHQFLPQQEWLFVNDVIIIWASIFRDPITSSLAQITLRLIPFSSGLRNFEYCKNINKTYFAT